MYIYNINMLGFKGLEFEQLRLRGGVGRERERQTDIDRQRDRE